MVAEQRMSPRAQLAEEGCGMRRNEDASWYTPGRVRPSVPRRSGMLRSFSRMIRQAFGAIRKRGTPPDRHSAATPQAIEPHPSTRQTAAEFVDALSVAMRKFPASIHPRRGLEAPEHFGIYIRPMIIPQEGASATRGAFVGQNLPQVRHEMLRRRSGLLSRSNRSGL